MGYDIHRLREGRKMVIGGVEIDHPKGPEGHSDGDVLLHAISDAILGALASGDIGEKFPDTDPAYKDVPSSYLLEKVRGIMDKKGFKIANLDAVVIAEDPKIAPLREKIAGRIKDILKLEEGKVSVKGKTSEALGDIGSGSAMAAYAVVLLEEK